MKEWKLNNNARYFGVLICCYDFSFYFLDIARIEIGDRDADVLAVFGF